MALRDVAALGSLVVQIASAIIKMGNNWYQAKRAWIDFQRKVATLERKLKFWEAQFSIFGVSSDAHLMEALRSAKSLLEEEKRKLVKAQNSSGCIPWLGKAVFPDKVGLSIQTAIDAFDEIPEFLKLEEESRTALQNRVLNKPRSLPFHNDEHNRYVRLDVSEREIQWALMNGGPNVVLLHGGAGRGKSTLARYLTLQYNNYAREHALFDRVVFLGCGQKLEKLSKQMELLQYLGGTATLRSDPGQCWSDSSIPTLLQSALKDQKILMVLDDLWDRDFLQEMVNLFGSGVKCLVTAQDADLCRGLNFAYSAVKIQMETEDSKKILASHVGFSNQLIPADLDDIVDTIVQKAEGHPLALALIATAIDWDQKNDLRTWENALEEFSKVLRNAERTNHVVGDKYSKSFFSAMHLPIQRLSNDARQLLVLTHICCDSGSVAEEVVSFLYKYGHFQQGGGLFGSLRRELQSLELLQIETCRLDTIRMEHSKWSCHSLQHFFIENEMREEKNAMITRFLGLLDSMESLSGEGPSEKIPTDEEIMMVLCALNSYPNFALKVASKMEIPTDRFDSTRKSNIEPIFLLLGQPQSDRWPAAAESSARLVLVTYICKGALHDDAISHMLGFPASQEPMLTALFSIVSAERASLLNESTNGLVTALIRLFAQRDTLCTVNYFAAAVIGCLASNASDCAFLISSGALNEALKLLCLDFDSMLQHAPAVQQCTEPATVPETDFLTNFPGILDDLLYQPCTSLLLQHVAMTVLFFLTRDQSEETNRRVVHTQGILKQLVTFLSEDSHPEMQTSAARLLASVGTSKLTVLKIINFPKALEQLTLLLSNDTHSSSQASAGLAFCNFTGEEDDEILLKIGNYQPALHHLVLCLSKDSPSSKPCIDCDCSMPTLQESVLSTLYYLTKSKVISWKIANLPNALKQLTALLDKENVPVLRRMAAEVIFNMSSHADSETTQLIVNCPRALDHLVQCLSYEGDLPLQAQAARTLAKLARINKTMLKIITFGSADELNKSPVFDQQRVASFVCILALEELDLIKTKFYNCVEQIVSALTTAMMQILNFPVVVEKLMDTLSKGGILHIQVVAAKTICYLSKTFLLIGADLDEKMTKFRTHVGVAEGLSGLLAEHVPPSIQGFAAAALTYINPSQANEARLYSGQAYYARGSANLCLDLYKEALSDFCKAYELQPKRRRSLGHSLCVRAGMGDFQGALTDADRFVEDSKVSADELRDIAHALQDRGVLKLKMGDLPGAMADLDKALELDGDRYEVLKHRGYVAFRMKEEEKARVYAERALKLQEPDFSYFFDPKFCLGTTRVEYMDYKL